MQASLFYCSFHHFRQHPDKRVRLLGFTAAVGGFADAPTALA